MDCARLDELIKIPKKSDASNSVKAEFKNEISTLLNEEGISNDTMKYVYSGFSFCGAVPLYDYLKNSCEETKLEIIKTAFSYDSLLKNENGIALRMAMHLLYFELSNNTHITETIDLLLNLFNRNSKSKEGGFRKDLSKAVEKYFVNCIKSADDLKDFNTEEISDARFVEFKSIMIYALNGIKPLKSKTARSLEIIRNWIGYTHTTSSVITENTGNNDSHSNVETENAVSESNMIQTIEYIISSIPEYQTILSQFLFKYRNLIDIKAEVDELRNKLERSNERLEDYKDELKSAAEQVDALTSQKHALMFQISQMTEQINSLIADNERQKKIISVYTVDKSDSQNEQLNAIASKLKSEYKDFKEAEDMEMTIDLGENLRFQMRSIFKILSKSGIDVEGR